MLHYNYQSRRKKHCPLISCHHPSVIPQTIYDYNHVSEKMGDHPAMFYYRENEESPNYDVGVSTEGRVTTVLTHEDGDVPGAKSRVVRVMLHWYAMAYLRHLMITQDAEACAFNPGRDAFWNFWEW